MTTPISNQMSLLFIIVTTPLLPEGSFHYLLPQSLQYHPHYHRMIHYPPLLGRGLYWLRLGLSLRCPEVQPAHRYHRPLQALQSLHYPSTRRLWKPCFSISTRKPTATRTIKATWMLQ